MTEVVRLTPIGAVKEVVDLLADLGLDPLHLHVDGQTPTSPVPGIRLWMRYRSDFTRVCERLGAKQQEARYAPAGQRQFYAEHDTDERKLLVHCASLEHHPDTLLASDWYAAERAHWRAEALREAAAAWQWGGWAVLTPAMEDRSGPALIIAAAQAATDWLRNRADAALDIREDR